MNRKSVGCRWKYDEWHDYYDTGCGQAYCLEEGSPATNTYKYCPGCGGRIEVRLPNSKAANVNDPKGTEPEWTKDVTRPLMVTEEENNYLWHLADNHKMTTTGEEPDALMLCSLLQKLGYLRESQWPSEKGQP